MKDEALKIYCAMLAAGQQQGPRLMADAMDQAEKFNREFDSRMEKAREEGRSKELDPKRDGLQARVDDVLKPLEDRGNSWSPGSAETGLRVPPLVPFPKVFCHDCTGSGWVTGGIIRSKKVKCSECGGVGFLP